MFVGFYLWSISTINSNNNSIHYITFFYDPSSKNKDNPYNYQTRNSVSETCPASKQIMKSITIE